MRILSYTVKQTDPFGSVAAVLRGGLRLSNGLIARLKRSGGIMKNGLPARANERAMPGDVVSAAVGESPAKIGRAEPKLKILFEDEDILVIDKPAGWGTHISRHDPLAPSVEAAVDSYYGKQGLFHPVNRLDRGTSGAMAIAKNGFMHEKLALLLHTNAFERSYLGVIEGRFEEERGSIDLPIARDEASPIKRIVSAAGRSAVTNYRVIETKNGFSLVEFTLKTGRTHQIRVHAAARGCPIVGDFLYGTENKSLIARPALHSVRLAFTHPLSGEGVRLSAPLPADILALIE